MTQHIVAWLANPDRARELPVRKPRPGTDMDELRREARKLKDKRDQLARLLAEDVLTEKGVRAERTRIDTRLGQIKTVLADDQPDLLPELANAPDDPAERKLWVQAMWNDLPLARRRVITKRMVRVTILPMEHRGGNVFNPAFVKVEKNYPS